MTGLVWLDYQIIDVFAVLQIYYLWLSVKFRAIETVSKVPDFL